MNTYIRAIDEYNNDKVPISDRPFPCDSDFDEDLKSDIADVLQVRTTLGEQSIILYFSLDFVCMYVC
jgi:hypothetical protein